MYYNLYYTVNIKSVFNGKYMYVLYLNFYANVHAQSSLNGLRSISCIFDMYTEINFIIIIIIILEIKKNKIKRNNCFSIKNVTFLFMDRFLPFFNSLIFVWRWSYKCFQKLYATPISKFKILIWNRREEIKLSIGIYEARYEMKGVRPTRRLSV